jgi:hypothetical protein
MKKREVCVAVVVVVGLARASYADDNASKKDPALPLLQLRDYSVELKANKNPSLAPAAPAGLTPLSRETIEPSIGLSLTKPLSK